ncbi:photosystem i subunit o [Phtheirospermum japonicum]|uniref:Photosystem i subunit o n=1 Tax=Phtheirospermum japonicum TaxID=374723 RepID=A0A830D6B7_9LAMI|nr:photosystem i subunit o [Phtheirospermum japonicum]
MHLIDQHSIPILTLTSIHIVQVFSSIFNFAYFLLLITQLFLILPFIFITLFSPGFLKSPVTARNPLKLAQASGGKFTCFERDWLRRDLNVIGFGLIGWIAPSSIPAINGQSLTGLFFSSIGTELAHFPTGPALTSPFWLWLVCWHLGLFLTLTFGQIGFKGRTEEYF